MQLIDTHCHLNLDQFALDLDEVIARALAKKITKIIVPGIDLPSSEKAIELSDKYEIIFASIGMHPNDGNKWTKDTLKELRHLAQHPKVVAIGEIGLDYFWDECSRETQQLILEEQLLLADELNLPVILHSRNSYSDLLRTLEKWKMNTNASNTNPVHGVLHAFEGNFDACQMATEIGYLIGIGGPVTYKNSLEKQAIAEKMDLTSLVLETDSPFLSPVPYRGKRNEPSNITLIAERIAQIRNIQIKLVSEVTTKNANKVFALEY